MHPIIARSMTWNPSLTRTNTPPRGERRPSVTAPSSPKYPDVEVQLSGEDGNAFVIIGRCRQAMRRADLPAAEIQAFTDEAKSGDYDNVLRTAMKWFDVS